MENSHYDFIIIGSGAGGGTLAYALADTGKRILVIERGDYIERSKDNWDSNKVFRQRIYDSPETWYTGRNKPFRPKQYYCVGGSTKFFGCVFIRFRKEDFGEVRHPGGISPAWPISYEDMEPYYTRAEQLYGVRGARGEDVTEPPASTPFPFPPIRHEPIAREIFDNLCVRGYKPARLPVGLDLNEDDHQDCLCIRCNTCDGFPCLARAKSDTEVCCVRPALRHENVELLVNTKVVRLETDSTGRVVKSVVARNNEGGEERFSGDIVVLSAGAINSALILLRSRTDKHPNGLANGSGMVGRNLMYKTASSMLAVNPFRTFHRNFLKTILLSEFYFGDPLDPGLEYPLGNAQLMSNITSGMLKAVQPLAPWAVTNFLTAHSIPWYVMTEDIPTEGNRLELTRDGRIRIHYKRTNVPSHKRLLKRLKDAMRSIGFRWIITRKTGPETTGHQCGTTSFGADPVSSVLDPFCKAHELENLYVVDTGFFPSSSSMNPALTVIANALRVADHLKDRI